MKQRTVGWLLFLAVLSAFLVLPLLWWTSAFGQDKKPDDTNGPRIYGGRPDDVIQALIQDGKFVRVDKNWNPWYRRSPPGETAEERMDRWLSAWCNSQFESFSCMTTLERRKP